MTPVPDWYQETSQDRIKHAERIALELLPVLAAMEDE